MDVGLIFDQVTYIMLILDYIIWDPEKSKTMWNRKILRENLTKIAEIISN